MGTPKQDVVLAGRYRLRERIASDDTAEVWRASTTGAGGVEKKLAVKILRDAPRPRAAFVEQACLAELLLHRNVVQTLDVGEHDGDLFVVLEHVEGVSLATLLARLAQRGRRLAVRDALHVIDGLLAALEHALAAPGLDGRPLGMAHGRPDADHVLVSRGGTVKLAGFGLGRGEARADLRAVGRLLGELIEADERSPRLAALLTRAGEDGFASPTALREALRPFLAGDLSRRVGTLVGEVLGDAPERRAPLRPSTPRRASARPVVLAGLAGALAGLVAFAGLAAGDREPPAAWLSVQADAAATVVIDGEVVGPAPLVKWELPAGTHALRVDCGGRRGEPRALSLAGGTWQELRIACR